MEIILIVFGLSSGLMVGAGVISILVLIGVIPRIARVSKTTQYISVYEKILIIGTTLGSLISIQNITLYLGLTGIILSGLTYGIFIGFFSSALTEILEFIPTISRRVKIPIIYLRYIIIALILGKVIGSFIGWNIINGG